MNALPVILCAVAVVASGAAHGVYTHRWQPVAGFDRVQAALDGLPPATGGWRSESLSFLDPDDLPRAGVRAHLYRAYQHPRRDKPVTVLVIAGLPGPVTVHTPDVCFRGLGYESLGEPERVTLPAGEFWRMECRRPGAAGRAKVFVYWAWDGGNGWEAPSKSAVRVRYAFRPVLAKLYLVAEAGTGPAPDPIPEFAAAFAPDLTRALAPEVGR